MRKLKPGKPTPIKKKEDMTYGEYYKDEVPKILARAGLSKETKRIQDEKLFIPSLKTKKLNNVDNQTRELVKGNTSSSSKASKPKLKGLMDKAMSRYKKTDKVGMGGRSVSKEKGLFTRTVDGRNEGVYEKTKTVKRADGIVKKIVTKGKGVEGSVIGRYKDVKRFK